jgi:hypothetical protein
MYLEKGLIAAGNAKTTPLSVAAPAPLSVAAPWPEQFHAVVITNHTARGGRLQQIDIYYDWPCGRVLNIIRDQLDSGGGEPPLRDVQWTNGTSFLFDSVSCRTYRYPVGLLPQSPRRRHLPGARQRRRLRLPHLVQLCLRPILRGRRHWPPRQLEHRQWYGAVHSSLICE